MELLHALTGLTGERPRALHDLQGLVDRAGYRFQQGGLAFSLGLVLRIWHRILTPGLAEPTRQEMATLYERLDQLLREDLANVERGAYPRELLFQLPYGAYLRLVPEALADAPRILRRSRRGDFSDLPEAARAEHYPAYYLRNFHWQTDGWLSDRSARLYDLFVEILFGGTADVMRRMAIPPITELMRTTPRLRVLDVACGTGRFLLQLHRAAPRLQLHGLDLSPPYVDRARALVPAASFVVANAETIPEPDASFDAVSSIFLFHELPRDTRRVVAREALRVLRPGGRFVVCDSAQLADGVEMGFFLERFKDIYHEPYYKGYLRDDLTALLTEVGFESVACSPRFVSKLVVATKAR